jgi:hypothetical protein
MPYGGVGTSGIGNYYGKYGYDSLTHAKSVLISRHIQRRIDMAEQAKSGQTYEPELTGLLMVDPYNDFLSDGGKLHELSRSTLEVNNVVEHMRQILAAARAGGLQVFIAPHHRWREGDQHSHWSGQRGVASIQNTNAHQGSGILL